MMQVSMSGLSVMDKLNVSLGVLAALLTLPVTLMAASPRPLTGQTAVVTLSPQIEQLEATQKAPALPASTGSAVEKPAGRDSYPPARQFWKRWRSSSDARGATDTEKTATLPPKPEREIVTISDLQLEPLPQNARPAPQPTVALPEMQVPPGMHPAQASPPSVDLILPTPEESSTPCDANYDYERLAPTPQTVAPQSLKMGKGFRFPYLSSLSHLFH